MRIILIFLLLIVVLPGCCKQDDPSELDLEDLVFSPDLFEDKCFLKPIEPESGLTGNPVLSSKHDYAISLANRWFDRATANSTEGILLAIYRGDNESDEVGLLAVEFDSNSTAKEAREYLEFKYPDEDQNTIEREKAIVIWLWQDSLETDACFEQLNDLVEEELRMARFDIDKRF